MKVILGAVGVLVIVAGIAYGSFRIERWYHYKFGYQSKVEESITERVQPLERRLKELEARVKELESQKQAKVQN